MFSWIFLILIILGASLWTIILLLPWRPWDTQEHLDPEVVPSADLSKITVLIPARNEADTIKKTLLALKDQGPELKIIVIDDQSTDGTSRVIRETLHDEVQIIQGRELPSGWAGKLWALEQARTQVQTPYILLLDADIELAPGILAALLQKLETESLDLVSIMAHLRMKTFAEKLLIPSFIYFFKLLYPFSIANNPRSKLGVAAGGCILTKSAALEKIGGFAALKGALIDDCTLAQKMKTSGFRTWIGLSRSVTSHRGYSDLRSIWNMVARSAYTQLHYSLGLLATCSLIMLSMFVVLPTGLAHDLSWMRILSVLGLYAMIRSYLPTLQYYRLSPLWAFMMPLIGFLYLLMTWTSAIRFYRGKRSEWKGRVYAKAA